MHCHAYQRLLQRTFDRRIPLFAHWELTYACNLSCGHCYANIRDRPGELNLAEIRDGLDQLAAAGCLFLAFTGGEVFCRPDLFDILDAAHDKGFALRLLTNGTRLDAANAERLASLGPAMVEITLYAMNPSLHDAIAGVPGAHRQTLAGIANCRTHGLAVTIKSPLMRSNVGEFDALRAFARDLGIELRYDLLLVPADNGMQPMATHGLTEAQLLDFVRRHSPQGTGGEGETCAPSPTQTQPLADHGSSPPLPARAELDAKPGSIQERTPSRRREDTPGLPNPALHIPSSTLHAPRSQLHALPPPTPIEPRPSSPPSPDPDAPLCGAGASTLCISPYGDVFPCLAIRQPAGNLRTQALRDIWESAALAEIRQIRQRDLQCCANCALAVYCPRCPGVALAESGSLLGCSESARILASAARELETATKSRSG